MRNLLLIVLLATIASCTKTVYVPITQKVTVHDSVQITVRDTIVRTKVERQFNSVITTQKSRLSTDYSFSMAWIDDSAMLHHTIENIGEVPLKIVYRDRDRKFYVNKTIDKPYKVVEVKEVVPRWCWWLLGGNLLALIVWILIKRFR